MVFALFLCICVHTLFCSSITSKKINNNAIISVIYPYPKYPHPNSFLSDFIFLIHNFIRVYALHLAAMESLVFFNLEIITSVFHDNDFWKIIGQLLVECKLWIIINIFFLLSLF